MTIVTGWPGVKRCCVLTAVHVLGVCLLVSCGGDDGPGSPGDTEPPAAVSDLLCTDRTLNSVTLVWTAPGDDGAEGQATEYGIRWSLDVITEESWSAAEICAGIPTPRPAGQPDTCVVSCLNHDTTYHFALKSEDDSGNWSGLSNGAIGTTSDGVEVMDQSQPLRDYGYGLDIDAERWQEFIPNLSNLSAVAAMVKRVGFPGDVIVAITDEAGTLLCEETFPEALAPQGYTWLRIVLSNEQCLVPGEEYRIWLRTDQYSATPDDRYFWGGSAQSSYDPECYSSEEYRYPGYKFAFKTYGYVEAPG